MGMVRKYHQLGGRRQREGGRHSKPGGAFRYDRASFDTVAALPAQDDENLEPQNYSSS
jgi:hypothetical protein